MAAPIATLQAWETMPCALDDGPARTAAIGLIVPDDRPDVTAIGRTSGVMAIGPERVTHAAHKARPDYLTLRVPRWRANNPIVPELPAIVGQANRLLPRFHSL